MRDDLGNPSRGAINLLILNALRKLMTARFERVDWIGIDLLRPTRRIP